MGRKLPAVRGGYEAQIPIAMFIEIFYGGERKHGAETWARIESKGF